MRSSYVAPLLNTNWPVPGSFLLHQRLHLHPLHLVLKPTSFSLPNCQLRSENFCFINLYHTSNDNKKEQENYKINPNESHSHPNQNHLIHDQFLFCTNSNTTYNKDPENRSLLKGEEKEEKGKKPPRKGRGIFTKMWWADLKAALGQRINVEAIVTSVGLFVNEQHLVLPHVRVPDIRYIDWAELHSRGFKGVVFDKDNTITVPYSLSLWAPLGQSMEQCKSVFGNNIAVFSNSAGLHEYDHDGRKARIVEKAIGIKVIRHRVKKPAGTAEEIEKHFGCKSSQLIMVGDRPFTDIVYGNKNGFLTILTQPLSLDQEPFIVRQVRKLEVSFSNYWFRRGVKPVCHVLLPDALQCIKDPPHL